MNDNAAGRIECRKICPLAVAPPLRAEIPFAHHAAHLQRILKFKSGKVIEVNTITATNTAVDRLYRDYFGLHRIHAHIPADVQATCSLPERLDEILKSSMCSTGGSERCSYTPSLPYFSLHRLPDRPQKK